MTNWFFRFLVRIRPLALYRWLVMSLVVFGGFVVLVSVLLVGVEVVELLPSFHIYLYFLKRFNFSIFSKFFTFFKFFRILLVLILQ